jgi:hypothetical protein
MIPSYVGLGRKPGAFFVSRDAYGCGGPKKCIAAGGRRYIKEAF